MALKKITNSVQQFLLSNDESDKLLKIIKKRYPNGRDPWGLNLDKSRPAIRVAGGLYKNYFKTKVFGKENVENRNYIVVANHSGQIPFDGMILSCAFLLDVKYPRILRTMVERFVTTIPFFSSFVSQNGGVLGDRSNCSELLKRGESVLVFPEGARGIAKNTGQFYQLQHFTRGFYRLAIKNKVPILPVSVVGAEEFYPLVHNFKSIAKVFKVPAFPLTPLFPFVGFLGAIPLPSPVDVHIGEPIEPPEHLNELSSDEEIDEQVDLIKLKIDDLLKQGLKTRRPFWGQKIANKFSKS